MQGATRLLFVLPHLKHKASAQVELVVKKLPANAEDTRDPGSIPELGRSPGGGHGIPLQYSCLKNSMDYRSLVNYSHNQTQPSN